MLANLGRRGTPWELAAGCGVAAALGVGLFWGFTVDDALVTARVAWRIANGLGYRFNASGPVVDAVTPLGWVYVLAPFAKISPLGALFAARCMGAALWVAAAMWCGYLLGREGRRLNFAVPLLMAAPLGAWASAGMETGLVVALCTVALGESWAATLAAGVAAALRPELLPFCAILGIRQGLCGVNRVGSATLRVGFMFGLFSCVAFIRHIVFGRVLPLAALAKPSDFEHGVRYAMGALFFLGPTWPWIGPGWKRLETKARWFAIAVAIHFLTLIIVGGDWMPLWRLALPAMPAAFWVSNCLWALRRNSLANTVWGMLAIAIVAYVGLKVGAPGRHVMHARLELIREAAPLLKGAKLVAGLDVGWLGVATRNDIMDLAGITDPRIALIPGGHTTKRIQNSWFDSLRPDALVLLLASGEPLASSWWESQFARGVENRVSALQYWQGCTVRGQVPLKYTRQFYVVVRCD
jgi:hypothetical protein